VENPGGAVGVRIRHGGGSTYVPGHAALALQWHEGSQRNEGGRDSVVRVRGARFLLPVFREFQRSLPAQRHPPSGGACRLLPSMGGDEGVITGCPCILVSRVVGLRGRLSLKNVVPRGVLLRP
jgi:hypothetical protein